MNYGDIVLIEHYASHDGCYKIRPVLVVSTDNYNSHEEDRILIPLSTNIKRDCPDDIIINEDDAEFKATGLKTPSAIRTGKIFTAKKDIIKRRLGCLSVGKIEEVKVILRRILAL